MRVPDYVVGCISPVFTAFRDDGAFDETGQRHLLDFMFERGGISAYFVRSGLGQMYTFELDDVKQMARTACGHLAGKAPVLVGCSGIWDRNYDCRPDAETFIAQAVELSRFAEDAGAAAVVHTNPEALLPEAGESVDAMRVRFFSTVCDAVSIPVFIYQTPGTLPEYVASPEALARLADIDNLCGMKASTNDACYVFNALQAVKDKDFGFIVGAETAYYAGLYAGARAVIGQGCTMNPQTIRAILERFDAGDHTGAVEAQAATNRLVDACPNAPAWFKRYAAEHGHPVGTFARSTANSPYLHDRPAITNEQYEAFQRIYEAELAPYL